ncbi:hypothetical protein IVB22_26740 [Bradyrhizobium sp. 190]|nr:hypothetical protein [Bradyrhizobium sp. 190]
MVNIALRRPTMQITLRSRQATAGPGGEWRREADRAAHALQSIVRSCRRGRREEAAPGGDGFIDTKVFSGIARVIEVSVEV